MWIKNVASCIFLYLRQIENMINNLCIYKEIKKKKHIKCYWNLIIYIIYIYYLLILENIFGKEPIERKRKRASSVGLSLLMFGKLPGDVVRWYPTHDEKHFKHV